MVIYEYSFVDMTDICLHFRGILFIMKLFPEAGQAI